MPDPIVPDLSFLKGLLYEADGHNLVQSYNAANGGRGVYRGH